MATQIVQINRTDGAATVEIPEEILRQANLAVGDPVEWTLTSGGSLALRVPCAQSEAPAEVEDGYEQWKLHEIQAGIADHDAGRTVDHERVVDWLNSWGTKHEMPPPV